MKNKYTLIFFLVLSTFLKAQTATFSTTYLGFTPAAQAAFQYATDIWANTITSTVPIKVTAHFTPLPSGTLGITFPNGRKNFTNAPVADTWYVTALANAIAGAELNVGEADIELYLNSTINWNYGLTGSVPANKYDFVTIALHELCHGLGFLSVAKDSTGIGSFGMLRNADFGNLVSAFPWPNLDTLPAIFDRLLYTAVNQKLDSFPNPSVQLSGKFKSNAIFIDGNYTLVSNNGVRPKIYAPASFALGSSITHLDEATYPAGNINELMTPNGNAGYALHQPGPICLGILKDIGWILNPLLGFAEIQSSNFAMQIVPNPSKSTISIIAPTLNNSNFDISIYNTRGSLVLKSTTLNNISIDLLNDGLYLIAIKSADGMRYSKFVKN